MTGSNKVTLLIKYLLSGLASTTSDLFLFTIAVYCGGNAMVSAVAAFMFGMVINYIMNLKNTFKVQHSSKMFFRYFTIVLINVSVTVTFIGIFESYFNSPILGKLFSLPIVLVFGFTASQYWVYRIR